MPNDGNLHQARAVYEAAVLVHREDLGRSTVQVSEWETMRGTKEVR